MRFSIVFPTQDRATLLSAAVMHAMRLDHPDFEVIVSDNSTTAERRQLNREAVDAYLDAPNFRIVQPPHVMSPPEHFEFAMEHASGEYVAYLTDKMMVFPHALSDVDAVIRASGADIVNWACAGYYLEDPASPLGAGSLVEEFEFLTGQPEAYDPIAALRFKAGGAVPRDKQGTRDYVLGKLVFGCYSRELIDAIRARSGTIFGGATHDYSAMVQALSLARGCVMLNAYEAIVLALPRDQSLGSATAGEPQRALQYYRTFTRPEAMLASLPVPGVYASQHNMVAHDYRKFLPIYGHEHLFDERNWIRAIGGDLVSESMIWASPAEKEAQLRLFRRHVRRHGLLLGVKLRRRFAELHWRDPPATARTVPAASLEEAMEHVVEQRRGGNAATPDADAASRIGPLDAPVKVVLALALALRTPELRAVLWRYLASAVVNPRTASSLPAVLEDLLKLAIVHRIRAARFRGSPRGMRVAVERLPAEVVLRSVPPESAVRADAAPAHDVAAPRRVTWDHSAVGADIRWPLPLGGAVRVSIGEPGRHVHEFRSLPGLAARFPVQVVRALPWPGR